jgi:hypothetical protein
MATKKVNAGNYVSEWFGQRVYPVVKLKAADLQGDKKGVCPFLTEVLTNKTICVKKKDSSAGVCTVSSVSNGPRQDWLVCPYRVIASDHYCPVPSEVRWPEASTGAVCEQV